MARTGNRFKPVALAAFLLSLIGAACGSGAGGPAASASLAPRSNAPTPSPSVAASPSPATSATDIVSTTPPLALPATFVPIGSAQPMTDWVVGGTLAAPGMGTAVFADGAVWAVNRKDGGFTGDVPNGEIYRIDPSSGKTTATVEHARGGFPTVGLGAIWLVNAEFGQTVTRVDLKTLQGGSVPDEHDRGPGSGGRRRRSRRRLGREQPRRDGRGGRSGDAGGHQDDPAHRARRVRCSRQGGDRRNQRLVRHLPNRRDRAHRRRHGNRSLADPTAAGASHDLA